MGKNTQLQWRYSFSNSRWDTYLFMIVKEFSRGLTMPEETESSNPVDDEGPEPLSRFRLLQSWRGETR